MNGQEQKNPVVSNTDRFEYLKNEYHDASQNFRHYSSLRFAIFTVYIAVLGGLITVAFGDEAKFIPSAPGYAKVGGLLFTIVFWLYEERAYQLLKHFRQSAINLEESLGYTQFNSMPINKLPIIEPAYLATFLFAVLTLFWGFWAITWIADILS